MGIHHKTLSRYVAQGKIRPWLRLPSGQMRWNLDDLTAQMRALQQRDEDDE